MKYIQFPHPVSTQVGCITDGKGAPLSELLVGGRLDDLDAPLPVIKPEDFEGNTIAEKVIAANEFLLLSGGGYELYFGDTSTYLITQAIVLPSNTRVRVNGCTIQMADNTVDNMFRTANIIPDPYNPRGFAQNKDSMEGVHNIQIKGENSAVLLMCNNASTGNYGVDYVGWRGHTIMFAGVSNFEITGLEIQKGICWTICLSGCCYGEVHDIVYATTRDNGDGVDVEFGSHDIKIYNLSGSLSDDIVAISNSGPSRLEKRPLERRVPTCPFDYGYRRFGEETYNIFVYNVNAKTLAHCVIFICGDYGIHDCSVAKVSDKSGSLQGSIAVVKIYDGEFDGGYEVGMIHNCTVNDIAAYGCSLAAITAKSVIQDGSINKVRYASGITLLNNISGLDFEDYDFSITNTGALT